MAERIDLTAVERQIREEELQAVSDFIEGKAEAPQMYASGHVVRAEGDGEGNNADTDDDGDGESDAREDECGSDSLDPDAVPSDYDDDGICDSSDTDNTDGPGYVPEEDTNLGWSNVVPGFPSLFAAIALIGAAFLGRRKDD